MHTSSVGAGRFGWLHEITRYQWTVFLVAWLGWMLDTADFGLFALVLRPALTDLLGGHPPMAEIGRIGGILATVGLLGWAFGGFIFGIVADYIGRVRTLALSILLFSVFSACQGFGLDQASATSTKKIRPKSFDPWKLDCGSGVC